MIHSAAALLGAIETEYYTWYKGGEKTKLIDCQIEDITFKILFSRCRYFYPLPNCPTPAVIENRINIAISPEEKIKGIFESNLLKEGRCYAFKSDRLMSKKFELRFFANQELIEKNLKEEDEKYAPYAKPRWGIRHECTLI